MGEGWRCWRGVMPAVVLLAGCGVLDGFLGGPGPDVVAPAMAQLSAGDLPAASEALEALATEHPTHFEVATSTSYVRLLKGDFDGADALLAGLEATAGERLGEVNLRRAIVAHRRGDLDAVKSLGLASARPEGRLMAAEVLLVDIESDEAAKLLRDLVSIEGQVGETASAYLSLLDSNDANLTGLAETTALWAVGSRKDSVTAAEELVKALPGDSPERFETVLLWAGRAASIGLPDVASSLLADAGIPSSPDLAWRVQAIEGTIAAASGDIDRAVATFDALGQAGAPADGVADARATACALAADADAARRLVAGLESAAAARCLAAAGAWDDAKAAATSGLVDTWLEGR